MRTTHIGIFIIVSLFLSGEARSHCDTMNGPVVKDARLALEEGDITPVLKWIRHEDEGEVRALFEKTQIVRGKSAEAMWLADMYFFETVVRIHRAGEGVPYTGLKPEGVSVEAGIEAADRALQTGNVGDVVRKLTDDIASGIRTRFEHVQEAKKQAVHSVESGRSYVAAYVEFIHFVEGIHQAALVRESHNINTQDTHRDTH